MKKNIVLLSVIIFLMLSCNTRIEDAPGEDYSILFPFQGIDTPDISYSDMIRKQCNPSIPLEKYRYPGVKIKENVREYTVTLECIYNESNDSPSASKENISSRYAIRYINENKELVVIGTSDQMPNVSYILKNGVEKTFTFKVKSGFPMYLSIDGSGPRPSNVKAKIYAVSDDGIIESPKLGADLYQNREGINSVSTPFCQYLILP